MYLEKSAPLHRQSGTCGELQQVLLLSSLFSIGLAFVRVVYTGELLFLFLVWNLLLAFLPYLISGLLLRSMPWLENNWKFALAFTAWLLFLPNSFYIITDLFHLRDRPLVPLWFDLALILSFAWNGLLLGMVSIWQMEKAVHARWRLKVGWGFVLPLMVLNALGIYIGRYLRYNSWDVLSNPLGLAGDVMELVLHPVHNRFDWSMILCYSVFMTLLYATLKKLTRV